jgi:L-lactate dehydrogenase (cytochrome)
VTPREILALIGRPRTGQSRSERALADTLTVQDFHRRARRRLPTPIADYLDGGADAERSLHENRRAFRDYDLVPRVLQDVSETSTSTTLFGVEHAAPLGLAPTGYTRLLSPAGEIGVATAAARRRVPYAISTVSTTTLEDVARASGTPPWFQLYLLKDRGVTRDMVARAAASGCPVLEIAVDTAVSGNRLRDRRNGLTIPPRLDASTLAQIGVKPAYWAGMLAGPSLEFANVAASQHAGAGISGGSIAAITSQFDPTVGWDDIAGIRDLWPGTLLLKGPIGAEDALTAKSLGVDGVHLSNHGGRQLDGAIAPIRLVPEVRAAAGDDFGILVDSGVRTGSDIAMALCLGADAAFIGRPYLWALVASGGRGVERVIDILTDELRRTMQLLGASSVADLRRDGHDLVRTRTT